ncbi:MAG: serine/threonine-protein kinase, partial [Polyangiaceae bacterium]
MGDVYRADHTQSGRPLAIKFLHPELTDNDDLAQRFFQEAQAVNRIRHPNIVDVIDAGVGELGPYIVMEYLEGESVGAALGRLGRFDTEAAIGTAAPVLEALDAAHRVGIIHRDLKPENVFIAFDSSRSCAVVRLLDFGIAKMLDGNGTMPRTRTGVVFGTPDYLSPEQATGELQIDGRSDLFAVGVLLYELLTGTRPFRAPTAVATAFRVVHAEVPNLAATGVYVDPRLEAVVQKLLQKEPSRRFPTAGDVVRDLNLLLPDQQRRTVALGRVINVQRRLANAAANGTGGSGVSSGTGLASSEREKDRKEVPAANSSRRSSLGGDAITPPGNITMPVAPRAAPVVPAILPPSRPEPARIDLRPIEPTLTSRVLERRRPSSLDSVR